MDSTVGSGSGLRCAASTSSRPAAAASLFTSPASSPYSSLPYHTSAPQLVRCFVSARACVRFLHCVFWRPVRNNQARTHHCKPLHNYIRPMHLSRLPSHSSSMSATLGRDRDAPSSDTTFGWWVRPRMEISCAKLARSAPEDSTLIATCNLVVTCCYEMAVKLLSCSREKVTC